MILDLTKEEVAIINELRSEQNRLMRVKEMNSHIIKTAFAFFQWLEKNGAGMTYSTFCDDFGYYGDNRPCVYAAIQEIALCVAEQSSKLVRGG